MIVPSEWLNANFGRPLKEFLLRHQLRNALVPIITVVGLDIGYLLGGSVVVVVALAMTADGGDLSVHVECLWGIVRGAPLAVGWEMEQEETFTAPAYEGIRPLSYATTAS